MREYVLSQAQSANAAHMFAGLHRIASNWLRRRKLYRLEELDDRMLDDIGLTRGELLTALRLPLVIDPLRELDRRSRARRVAGQRGR